MKALGLTVEEQPFDAATPLGPVEMVNLIVAACPDGQAALRQAQAGPADHCRPLRHEAVREFTFVGANDGGSSAAFLIELARVLKDRKNALPIELLFLDGEEAVVRLDTGTDHTYGSRHYVEAARKAGTLVDIRALILVDMIGDRDLRISRESNSTPWLTDIIWAHGEAAEAARVPRPRDADRRRPPAVPRGRRAGGRHHRPRLPRWHTADDTLDKVSPIAAGVAMSAGGAAGDREALLAEQLP